MHTLMTVFFANTIITKLLADHKIVFEKPAASRVAGRSINLPPAAQLAADFHCRTNQQVLFCLL